MKKVFVTGCFDMLHSGHVAFLVEAASFQAQTKLFPTMVNDKINTAIDQYRNKALAWKISGAGG